MSARFSDFCLALAAALALCAIPALASTVQQVDNPEFAGTPACAGCHAEEHSAWTGSHHDLAMQVANEATVLGDFDNASFLYNGITTRFSRRDDSFWVTTDGADGKLQDFKVDYVFGVYPLQQILLELPGGRLQALSIAWDSRSAEGGGQRWYHLHADEAIDASDPLHWTGPYYNWNARCAECHSTDLQKNYNPADQSYQTTWVEINVGCEACHGPGAKHVDLARTGKLGAASNGGFGVFLAERGEWAFAENESIAKRRQPMDYSRQVESCGRCHSRRGSFGHYNYGKRLLDNHRLSLLEDPLYHADGQILDEVYVYGSFVQSKMHQQGVVCSNCHEPHSNELRADGNDVCAQCHVPTVYDSEQHHHHAPESSGAQCANCHMPETTYMGVDPRRDHSMRIPRPDLSVVIQTPNACNMCHQDQSADWALNSLRDWGVTFSDTTEHPARAMHQARRSDARAVPQLQQLVADSSLPTILRATAMVELGSFAGREAYDEAIRLLQSPDPLLRVSAVRTLEFLPSQQRWQLLSPLVADPIKAVRLEVARVVSPMRVELLEPSEAAALQALYKEYLASLDENSDMPGAVLNKATFFTAQQRWKQAQAAYELALQLNPQLLPALLNLADLHRAFGREAEARVTLQRALGIAQDQPHVHQAMGLLESRAGNRDAALSHLRKAAELEKNGVRHRYVYAIALHDYGQPTLAIKELQALQRNAPENADVLLALVNYLQEVGRNDEGRRYAGKLLELFPDNEDFQRLYNNL
ncbi:tetratricopeptide repeat protein [Candidatus Litorirhabdus singularis]|nr:tetratricopeptide repeat protein [Candidatus Litorirhabdus singularis]